MAEIAACRSCGSAGLEPVLDLGRTPLADRLVSADRLGEPEPAFPLAVAFCPDCGLMQILETVPPEILFCEDYPYFSVTALDHLFRRHGLHLNEVRRLSIHGGSLRLYIEPSERVGESVRSLLALEREEGVDRLDYYRNFAREVESVKSGLLSLLRSLRADGKRIAAYGAAAKGATLINYVGIGGDLVDFVVDRNTFKQGRHMPGQHLPIFGPERLLEARPDYVLLLAWNFASEIREQQAAYVDAGGRFIVPVPEPGIL